LSNVGRFLLPDFLPALAFGALLLSAGEDPFATKGPHEPAAVDRKEPALLGRARPLVLHGFAPARRPAPLVLIAAHGDTPVARYDALARHLASHGFAALVLQREPGEVWSRYADALDLTLRQLDEGADQPGNPWSLLLDGKAVALVADRDAEAAAARAAASGARVGALVLIDGDDAGCAMPWLDRVRAPFLYVGASEATTKLAGLRSFHASGAAAVQRWHVRMRAPGPLLSTDDRSLPPAVLDLHALVARFLTAELAPDPDASAPMNDLPSLGSVERDCKSGRDLGGNTVRR
jgi:hypothetical protein